MQHQNSVSFRVYGRKALFTDPLTRLGGEKASYPVPTYQALKGIVESTYWKPTLLWVVTRMRVMKPIRTEAEAVRPIVYSGGNTLAIYNYLRDVEYQVEAHFIWNSQRPDLAADRNENKHYYIARRMIEKGGRRDIYLGTRECQAYLEPCVFGEGVGYYDNSPDIPFGTMVHGLNYPDETGGGQLEVRLWQPIMRAGVIEFPLPQDCPIVRPLRPQSSLVFAPGKNFTFCDDLYLEEGGRP